MRSISVDRGHYSPAMIKAQILCMLANAALYRTTSNDTAWYEPTETSAGAVMIHGLDPALAWTPQEFAEHMGMLPAYEALEVLSNL